MMKQKILFAMLAVVCLVGCGSDEEEFLVNNPLMPFAGVWNITEVNMGGSWQSAKSAGYGNTYIIFSEDSCYQTDGHFGSSYYHYKVEGGKIICTDYYDKLQLICQFKSISGQAATATITDNSGKSFDFRMERDESNPALYLDPLKFLDGTWDIHNDEGGYVSIYGYSADIHHSKFNAGYEIYRSPADISSFKLGSGLTIRFDLSKTPYTLSIAGQCYELNGKYINITCTKRDE